MVFWGDHTGLPNSYRGWQVGLKEENDPVRVTAAIVKLLGWLQKHITVDTVTLLLPVDQQNLTVRATLGLEEEILQQIQIPIGQGIAGRIAATGRPAIVNDLAAVEVYSPILRRKGLRSLVGVPLTMRDNKIGVLHVGSFKARQFNQRDVEQLQLVAQRLNTVMSDNWLFSSKQCQFTLKSCLTFNLTRRWFASAMPKFSV